MGELLISPMIAFWLVLLIAFVIGELVTVGLTSIWFAAGALVAMLLAFCNVPVAVQVVLFIVVSVGLLVATKPWAQRFINGRAEKTNADRAIGQIVRIT